MCSKVDMSHVQKCHIFGVRIKAVLFGKHFSREYPQSMFWAEIWNISEFLSEKFRVLVVKLSLYLNRRVFVMGPIWNNLKTEYQSSLWSAWALFHITSRLNTTESDIFAFFILFVAFFKWIRFFFSDYFHLLFMPTGVYKQSTNTV